jgi:hypothetical protein
MEATRLAPTVGIVASLLVLAVLAAPYALIEEGTAVTTYYDAGALNPLVVGLFALVAMLVLAAGRQGRSSPDVVAGSALVLGAFMFVIAALWALTVPEELVQQLTTETVIQYHRGTLVLVTLVVPLSAGWYARALRIF